VGAIKNVTGSFAHDCSLYVNISALHFTHDCSLSVNISALQFTHDCSLSINISALQFFSSLASFVSDDETEKNSACWMQ
jgi:hypothetical protein